MELLAIKNLEQLNEKAIERLKANGFNVSAGSIAKLFNTLINEDIADFYQTLNTYHIQAILSKAEGEYIDYIGVLLNCVRHTDESDTNYKYRISKQSLSLEKANETAIRLAALTVEGVQDVVLKNYSHGPATFSMVVLADTGLATYNSIPDMLNIVLSDVAAYGIKYYIYFPVLKPIKLKLKLQTETMTTSDLIDLTNNLTNVVRQYLNSRNIGEEFSSQGLTKIILDFDKRIKKFSVLNFEVSNKKYDFKIINCRWNERYILSAEPDALNIT